MPNEKWISPRPLMKKSMEYCANAHGPHEICKECTLRWKGDIRQKNKYEIEIHQHYACPQCIGERGELYIYKVPQDAVLIWWQNGLIISCVNCDWEYPLWGVKEDPDTFKVKAKKVMWTPMHWHGALLLMNLELIKDSDDSDARNHMRRQS